MYSLLLKAILCEISWFNIPFQKTACHRQAVLLYAALGLFDSSQALIWLSVQVGILAVK